MSDLPLAAASTLDGAKLAERLGVALFQLEVVAGIDLTPSMRRVVLRAAGLHQLRYQPGQDIMLAFPGDNGGVVRRRFTIRAHDATLGTIAVHVVRHGKGPGSRWAMNAAPGSLVEGLGPRGKVFVVPDAPLHVFAGDETFLPAAVCMIESLPAGTRATLVALVGSREDERPINTAAELQGSVWVHRASGGDLLAALRTLSCPAQARAYVGGEASLVRSIKNGLLEQGIEAERIAAKAYWRSDQSNAGHGEPNA